MDLPCCTHTTQTLTRANSRTHTCPTVWYQRRRQQEVIEDQFPGSAQESSDQRSGGCNPPERVSVDKAYHGTEGTLHLFDEVVHIYYAPKVDKIVWYCLHTAL